ncbi:MAG: stage III sporulation protein AE [Bacillota bacterium]
MNRTVIFFALMLLTVVSLPAGAGGELEREQRDIISRQMEELELRELQQEVQKINERTGDEFPALNLKELITGFLTGDFKHSWRRLMSYLVRYFVGEITANVRILGQIIVLASVSALLSVFHSSFSGETVSRTANLLIFMLMAALILRSFYLAVDTGVETIENMVSFMQALLPVLLTLLIGMGAVSAAAVFNPLTYLVVSTLASLLQNVVLPLLLVSAVLGVVDRLADGFSISRIAGIFREFSTGLLTLTMLLLVGGLVVQGGAAAAADSLSLRAAKYFTGTFIPVVGGVFTDAVDLVVSCSLIIKNALNFFGVLAVIGIIAFPLLKIAALIIIYRLAAAVLEPICDERLVGMLSHVAGSLVLLFVILLATAFMFFIVITIIAGTANLTVMMR